MKLYAISDLHGNLDGLDPRGADLVIIAGDFAIMKGWGIWHLNDQVKWIKKKFLPWCAKYPETQFCVIPGNHDLFAEHQDELHDKVDWPKNVHFIVNGIAEVCGLHIAGTSWIPCINGVWAFECDSPAIMAQRLAWIPSGIDILISHSPPYFADSYIDVSLQTHSPHFGSPELAEVIRSRHPRYVLCGHIHTGDHCPLVLTHSDATTTIIYNVSRLNENYEIAYEPLIVENKEVK